MRRRCDHGRAGARSRHLSRAPYHRRPRRRRDAHAGCDDAGRSIPVYADGGGFNAAAAFSGALAVDERDETTYVLQVFPTSDDQRHTTKTIWAVGAEAATARELGRFDDMGDTRMLFPESGVLVMSERSPDPGDADVGCPTPPCDQIRLYDRATLRELVLQL